MATPITLREELLTPLPDAMRARVRAYAEAIARTGVMDENKAPDRRMRYRLRFRTPRDETGKRRQLTISLGGDPVLRVAMEGILAHLRGQAQALKNEAAQARQLQAAENYTWRQARTLIRHLAAGQPWLYRQLRRDFDREAATRSTTSLVRIICLWPMTVHRRVPGRPGRPRKRRLW